MTFRILGISTLFLTATALPAFAADYSVADMIAPTMTAKTPAGVINLHLGAAYVKQDVANGLGTALGDGSFQFVDQLEDGADLSGFGVEGGIDYWGPASDQGGFYLGFDALGAWDHRNETTEYEPPVPWVDPLPIDGTPPPGNVTILTGYDLEAKSEVDFARFAGAGGYVLPQDMGGIDLAVGAYGSYSKLNLRSDVAFASDPDDVFVRMDERVATVSAGPMLAFSKKADVSDGGMDWFVDGRAALLYAHARLDATQDAGFFGPVIEDLKVDDTRNDFAGMVELRSGFTVASREGAQFSLYGGVGVRNDTYRIVNPRGEAGDDFSDTSSYDPEPAHLEQTLQMKASVGFSITGSF